MYYVKDLWNEVIVAKAKDKKELGQWWTKHNGSIFKFRDLNVTGNDSCVYRIDRGYVCYDGIAYPSYEEVSSLRRYQVLDDEGRSIDIRLWDESEFILDPVSYGGFYFSGAKRNWRRVHAPSGACRSLKENAKVEDDLDYDVIRDNSKVRTKSKITSGDIWDFYDKARARSWVSSKSWKDQTRARSQYSKHSKQNVRRASRNTEDTSVLVDALNREFGLCAEKEAV